MAPFGPGALTRMGASGSRRRRRFQADQIGTLTNWASVGFRPTSLPISPKSDGTLWAAGQLVEFRPSAESVRVDALTTWSSGVSNLCWYGFRTDGTLWVWGASELISLPKSITAVSSPTQSDRYNLGQVALVAYNFQVTCFPLSPRRRTEPYGIGGLTPRRIGHSR